ncbi:DEKNAAC105465 [Brettanomyces naardenensis]|uniref:DEKNAAC105465 n=1 Tax=Brettanomyces naardenensis TaxID=13370 RepID=A0A448YTB5_BRENA|nr:DEKNAAC105465 [Brettanomyces naardenensis]
MAQLQFLTKTIGWTDSEGTYHLNKILLQNQNGPCFIISFVNTLILSHELQDFDDWQTVKPKSGKKHTPDTTGNHTNLTAADLQPLKELLSSRNLVPLDSLLYELTNLLLRLNEKSSESDGSIVDLGGILNVLPLLSSGLNVNLKLNQSEVNDFAQETEPINQLLNLFDMRMVHGFISDDLDIGFDKAQELLVNLLDDHPELTDPTAKPSKDDSPEIQKYFKLRQFFEDNKSQLTELGLSRLQDDDTVLGNSQFTILFRNDHFSTLYKKDNKLYILVNDEGYKEETDVVWQTLTSVKGDQDQLLTGDYKVPDVDELKKAQEKATINDADPFSTEDEQLAKELQQEDDAELSRNLQRQYDKEVSQQRKKGKKKGKKVGKDADRRDQDDRNDDKQKQDNGCTIV